MDFGCIVHGYCSDMTRTVAVGYATDEMAAVYDTVLRAQRAGIAAAKPGATGREVDQAARSLIEAAGYGDCFGHGFGHGVGLFIHEDPRASQSWDQPLEDGVVLTAEPGHLPAGQVWCAHRGYAVPDRRYLPQSDRSPKRIADFIRIGQINPLDGSIPAKGFFFTRYQTDACRFQLSAR